MIVNNFSSCNCAVCVFAIAKDRPDKGKPERKKNRKEIHLSLYFQAGTFDREFSCISHQFYINSHISLLYHTTLRSIYEIKFFIQTIAASIPIKILCEVDWCTFIVFRVGCL